MFKLQLNFYVSSMIFDTFHRKSEIFCCLDVCFIMQDDGGHAGRDNLLLTMILNKYALKCLWIYANAWSLH